MSNPAEIVAQELVTLARRMMPEAQPSDTLQPARAADALMAMLVMTLPSPSHERDSERAELVRSIRASAHQPPPAN